MPRNSVQFQSFHEGMNAGHEAGRSQDVLYAVGFLVGFVWGAFESARHREQRTFERVSETA
jgi:hypothetical protein